MPVFRDEIDEVTDSKGVVLESTTRQRDVTAEVIELDAHAKLRAALLENRDYVALPTPTAAQTQRQVRALTRQVNSLIRLTLRDLLADDTLD